MAVRQYIGARYVPKFSDVNNGEWDNSYTYEPLTIVKYGNDFYTSKIPVPVGAAISDTKYWVMTGNYNGAISNLNDRVAVLENNMQYVVAERSMISAINAKVGDIIISENSYAGDGHVSYWLVATGTGDGYLSITLDNGLCASLIHDNNIYVHDVGAFPDGNNCEDAINAALVIPGVTLIFDAGTYTFDGRIWLSDYQKITGQGEDTILYCSQDPAGNHGEFIGVIRDSGEPIKGCRISNLSLDMYETSAQEDVNPIGINNAKDLIIENINILRSNWRGIQLESATNNSSNILIRNIKIKDTALNGIGISHTTGGSLHDVRLENIEITHPKGGYGGILIQGDRTASMTDISLEHVTIHTTADVPRGVYILDAYDVSLNDVRIDTSANITAYLVQIQGARNVRLSNIYINMPSGNNSIMAIGIMSSRDITLVNGVIYETDIGIRVSKISGDISPINILISNTIGLCRRYICYVDDSDATGFATGCIGTGTITSTGANFKEITA